MRFASLAFLALVSFWSPAAAQYIIAKDGFEEFYKVEYVGGDARQQEKVSGWLIVTDTTMAIHECLQANCAGKKQYYESTAAYLIDLRQVKAVQASSDIRGASVGTKLLIGGLAPDRKQDFVVVTLETETSAEAPVFKVAQNMGPALATKLRYRLRKLGLSIPLVGPDSSTSPNQGAPE